MYIVELLPDNTSPASETQSPNEFHCYSVEWFEGDTKLCINNRDASEAATYSPNPLYEVTRTSSRAVQPKTDCGKSCQENIRICSTPPDRFRLIEILQRRLPCYIRDVMSFFLI